MINDTRATIKPLQVYVHEAARILGFDTSTIRRMVQRGDLKATGSGKGRRIVYASLERWVQRNTEQ